MSYLCPNRVGDSTLRILGAEKVAALFRAENIAALADPRNAKTGVDASINGFGASARNSHLFAQKVGNSRAGPKNHRGDQAALCGFPGFRQISSQKCELP